MTMSLQVGVKVLVCNDRDEYLFIQRSVKMADEEEPHWDIPGGRIDPAEALADALARELNEETSMSLEGGTKLIGAQDIFVPSKDLHVVRLTYIADGNGDVAVSDEHEKHNWWSKDFALGQNIDPYVREILEKI